MKTTEDREFTITDKDGNRFVVNGQVITTEDGVDENGTPKRSVEIKVPEMTLGVFPGEVK
jgi:hypothetical protein